MTEQNLFAANEVISFESAIADKLIYSVSESYQEGELKLQCFMTNLSRALCAKSDVIDRVVEAALWDIKAMLSGGADASEVADGTDVYLTEHGIQIVEALHVSAVINDQDEIAKLFIGFDGEAGLVSGLAYTFL